MSGSCCNSCDSDQAERARADTVYRRVLWVVLHINAVMFFVEIGAGIASRSASLQADAVDFLGDAANYGISLFVVGHALHIRARASLAKAITMGVFGIWVLGVATYNVLTGATPHAYTMGIVGLSAVIANGASFALLWRFRDGDSNMRSAWICTRNDVVSNFAVLLAALGVFGTGTGWPDIVVASIMGLLAIQGAIVVTRQAMGELQTTRLQPAQ